MGLIRTLSLVLRARKQQKLVERVYSHPVLLPHLMSGVKPIHITICPIHQIVWSKEAEDQVEEELWAFKVLRKPNAKAVVQCRRSTWVGCYGQNSSDVGTFTVRQLKKVLTTLDTYLEGE